MAVLNSQVKFDVMPLPAAILLLLWHPLAQREPRPRARGHVLEIPQAVAVCATQKSGQRMWQTYARVQAKCSPWQEPGPGSRACKARPKASSAVEVGAAARENCVMLMACAARLELKDVLRFYLFFCSSGLSNRFDHIKLQIHGDLQRFQEDRPFFALR